MHRGRVLGISFAAVIWLLGGLVAAQQVAPPATLVDAGLDKEAIKQFLKTAKVVRSRQLGKGITLPWRLTLTDGTLTHDAAFQSVHVRKASETFARGGTEINFVDSYHYNLAAYHIAELLGIDHMMPVTVERQWNSKKGALSWWVTSLMDEGERIKKKVSPPDALAWNRQMYMVRVFSALVLDTDRNLGNMLVTPEWNVVMLDFTRAFRLHDELRNPNDLPQCERTLFERLQQLKLEDVRRVAGEHLTEWEAEQVLARRDRLVTHFTQLARERGEARVFY
jgi:hypothetical protein